METFASVPKETSNEKEKRKKKTRMAITKLFALNANAINFLQIFTPCMET